MPFASVAVSKLKTWVTLQGLSQLEYQVVAGSIAGWKLSVVLLDTVPCVAGYCLSTHISPAIVQPCPAIVHPNLSSFLNNVCFWPWQLLANYTAGLSAGDIVF